MQVNRKFPYYFAAVLIAVTAGLIGLIAMESIARELMQVLALIAGASFFSSLALLLGQGRQLRSAPFIQINFSGRQMQEDLSRVIDAEYTEVADDVASINRENYVDDDLVIALAKVRIDIERQIRRLASMSGAVREDQRFDLHRSLEVLKRHGQLPDVAISAIQNILPICNRALHGEQIRESDARNVIDIAKELMIVLDGELMKQIRVR